MSSDAFLIPFYRPVGDERRAVDTPAHIRCRVIISLDGEESEDAPEPTRLRR